VKKPDFIRAIAFSVLLFNLDTSLAEQSSREIKIEEISFESGDVELAGRLWLPDGPGPYAAAVFIPGSGQSIRHLDQDPDPLPHHLAEMGLALLAWDKRGVGDSGGKFEQLSDTDIEAQLRRLRELASDARAAMKYLAGRDDIDASRIGAWAFSQGGWVASQLESIGADPRFMIIVGGPAVSIGEELEYSRIADRYRQASKDGIAPVNLDDIYVELEQSSGDGFGGYDPMPFIESISTPTLFLLGEYDLSVPTRRSVELLEALGDRHEWIDYRNFPRANHGVATVDAAGRWFVADEFYETQKDYLSNLGVLEKHLNFEFKFKEIRNNDGSISDR
jgi:dipeptidyl aminopeptidase/acylaminoacyl peptidase